MIANPSTKQKFKTPQGCKGYNCNRCIHKSARPCLVATFNKIETTVIYEDSYRHKYKVSTAWNTYSKTYNYNRIDI